MRQTYAAEIADLVWTLDAPRRGRLHLHLRKEDVRVLRSLRPVASLPVLTGSRVAVYVITDTDTEQVIYIGQTSRPAKRLRAHRANRIWGVDRRASWFVARNRQDARRAEMLFIARLFPLLNEQWSEFQTGPGYRGITIPELRRTASLEQAVA